ncbi:hypothetical protein OPIT5_18005 [Opitutaceae bacterium TAV5]|nr:hypothetical protein OPIT5_18005 [Opitutaceae bacterium TAV5]
MKMEQEAKGMIITELLMQCSNSRAMKRPQWNAPAYLSHPLVLFWLWMQKITISSEHPRE